MEGSPEHHTPPTRPIASSSGWRRSADLREVVNATILYVLRNGIVWRALPETSETWTQVAMIQLMLKRMAPG